jgi:hypothetical protein
MLLQKYPNWAKLGRKSVFTGSSREKICFSKTLENATRCFCSVLGRKMLNAETGTRKGQDNNK